MKRDFASWLACGLILGMGGGLEVHALSIEVGANQVEVTAVTAGTKVAVLSVAREPRSFGAEVVRREALLSDDDGDGKVSLPVEPAVPFRSLWVAVELSTGDWALATPAGYPLRERPQSEGIRASESGAPRLELTSSHAELLIVRPGPNPSVWHNTLITSGPGDLDPEDALLTADLTGFQGSQPAPTAFAPGDVLVALDPQAMDALVQVVQVAQVLPPTTSGGRP